MDKRLLGVYDCAGDRVHPVFTLEADRDGPDAYLHP
jgi:hypothetical protein